MKVQCLNENLIKALGQIKENKVNICNVTLNRKLLLEALKVNKDFGLITLETGKRSWNEIADNGEYIRQLDQKPCLQISLDHTVMSFFDQGAIDYSRGYPMPAVIRFNSSGKVEGYALQIEDFAAKLSKVLTCVASEESRPSLTCVYFESNGQKLTMTSADGFRLMTTSTPCELPEANFLIEGDDISKLLKFLKGKDTIQIENCDTQVKFNHVEGAMVFDKLESTFPQYRQLIPANGNQVEFDSGDMLKAVKALKGIARDGTNIVRLEFEGVQNDLSRLVGKIRLTTKSEEIGESHTEIDAKINEPGRIAVNYKYLMAYLKLFKGMVKARLTTATSPIAFEIDDFTYVLMPMQVYEWQDKAKTTTPEPKDWIEESDEPEGLTDTLTDNGFDEA